MDGLKGKTLLKMDDLGGPPLFFGLAPIYFNKVSPRVVNSNHRVANCSRRSRLLATSLRRRSSTMLRSRDVTKTKRFG